MLDLSDRSRPTDHLAGIVEALAQRGYHLTVLSPKPQKEIARSFPANTSLLHYLNVQVLGLPRAVGGFLALFKLWKLRCIKALYVRSSPGTLPITLFGRLAGFKFIAVEHNGWLADELTSFGYGKIWKPFVSWCQVREANLATTNRVVTNRLRKLLADRGVGSNKLIVIGNGTDTRTFHPLDREECRRRLGIDSKTSVLAFIGNLWPGAGVETILLAMQVLKARGRHAELIIAGDGISRNNLEIAVRKMQQGQSLECSSPARFLGYISPAEANVVLGATDVALAPYLGERNAATGISPLKLYAYAAAGRACVVTSLPGT